MARARTVNKETWLVLADPVNVLGPVELLLELLLELLPL